MKKLVKNLPSRTIYEVDQNGDYRYRKKFTYKDANGKSHDTTTGWFYSIPEMLQNVEDLKSEYQHGNCDIRTQTVKEAFECYLSYLRSKSDIETDKKLSTDVNHTQVANSLYNKYFLNEFSSLPIRNLEPFHFSQWFNRINDDRNISGKTIRNLCSNIRLFVHFLFENGYFNKEEMLEINRHLDEIKLKPKSYGAKKNSAFPKINDIKKITNFYLESKKGDFGSIYWYTLFRVLFFTGMRVGELVALKWSDINFDADNGNGVISLSNSINQHETPDNVERRDKAKNYSLKNANSARQLTILSSYRQLLRDYRSSYCYHFNLSEKDILDNYVFTNYRSDKPLSFQRQKNILKELTSVVNKYNKKNPTDTLPHFSALSFRHGCASFLLYDMNYSAEDVHDYFGHIDSDMLTKIYTNFTQSQKRERVSKNMRQLIDDKEEKAVFETHPELFTGDIQNEHIKKARLQRMVNEMYHKSEVTSDSNTPIYFVSTDELQLISEHLKNEDVGLPNGVAIFNRDCLSLLNH